MSLLLLLNDKTGGASPSASPSIATPSPLLSPSRRDDEAQAAAALLAQGNITARSGLFSDAATQQSLYAYLDLDTHQNLHQQYINAAAAAASTATTTTTTTTATTATPTTTATSSAESAAVAPFSLPPTNPPLHSHTSRVSQTRQQHQQAPPAAVTTQNLPPLFRPSHDQFGPSSSPGMPTMSNSFPPMHKGMFNGVSPSPRQSPVPTPIPSPLVGYSPALGYSSLDSLLPPAELAATALFALRRASSTGSLTSSPFMVSPGAASPTQELSPPRTPPSPYDADLMASTTTAGLSMPSPPKPRSAKTSPVMNDTTRRVSARANKGGRAKKARVGKSRRGQELANEDGVNGGEEDESNNQSDGGSGSRSVQSGDDAQPDRSNPEEFAKWYRLQRNQLTYRSYERARNLANKIHGVTPYLNKVHVDANICRPGEVINSEYLLTSYYRSRSRILNFVDTNFQWLLSRDKLQSRIKAIAQMLGNSEAEKYRSQCDELVAVITNAKMRSGD